MKKILVTSFGAPEVMQFVDAENPIPKAHEILVENEAIGVNYTDIYTRTNSFGDHQLPLTPGKEGAGKVLALGDQVTQFKIGDRVAYVETPGAYSEKQLVPEKFAIKLPENISNQLAASVLLKGLTAQLLVRRVYPINAGDTILIHAAAGGVGSIVSQWAKSLGATVIGTVGSEIKRQKALTGGCDYVINYNQEDFAAAVMKYTNGNGVAVVYDSVGKDTFAGSLKVLKRFGYFVSFGQASGAVPPFPITKLVEEGSLFTTFPSLTDYILERKDFEKMAQELFDIIATKKVKITAPEIFPLKEAAKAHTLLESRKVVKSIVLVP